MNKKILAFVLVAGLIVAAITFFNARKENEDRQENKITPPEIKNQEKRLSYDEIKNLIGTGKITDVPSYINQSKRLIELEYLDGCYNNNNFGLKLNCYEEYYVGRDNSFKEQKNACDLLTDLDKTNCLDQYYYKLGLDQNSLFCEKIGRQDLSDDCKSKSE